MHALSHPMSKVFANQYITGSSKAFVSSVQATVQTDSSDHERIVETSAPFNPSAASPSSALIMNTAADPASPLSLGAAPQEDAMEIVRVADIQESRCRKPWFAPRHLIFSLECSSTPLSTLTRARFQNLRQSNTGTLVLVKSLYAAHAFFAELKGNQPTPTLTRHLCYPAH